MKLYELVLSEIKRTTTSKITRQSKIDRAVGSLSDDEAERKNDPNRDRMLFHLNKYKMYKDRVMKKYSSRVKSQARK